MRYCYPVFGDELSLEKALVQVPVALCIGYEREKGDLETGIREIGEEIKYVLRPHLEQASFDMEYAAKEFVREDGWVSGAIMVANERFVKEFPR